MHKKVKLKKTEKLNLQTFNLYDYFQQLPESERIKHILLIDQDPWKETLVGTSSFR